MAVRVLTQFGCDELTGTYPVLTCDLVLDPLAWGYSLLRQEAKLPKRAFTNANRYLVRRFQLRSTANLSMPRLIVHSYNR
jgi:hypothetical protein